MDIKDEEELIEYCEDCGINYHNHAIYVDCADVSISLVDTSRIINSSSLISKIYMTGRDEKDIENLVDRLPKNIEICLYQVSKKFFYSISLELACKVKEIHFSNEDREIELIYINDILEKFPNLSTIRYKCILKKIKNVTDLSHIVDLLRLNEMPYLNLDSELMEIYKEYCDNNPELLYNEGIVFDSQAIYSLSNFKMVNSHDSKHKFLPACILKDISDYSTLKKEAENKQIVFFASSMVDFPLDISKKLKAEGIDCIISINSYDNGYFQNEDYNLDEYIEMFEIMNNLIGDIDDSLPEKRKFGIIYECVSKYIEYDYSAAYPQTKEEEKYAKKNLTNCRCLRNALLYGKAVCGGYADVLKNACLLKGIECEYIQGPADDIESKEEFFSEKENNRGKLMHVDGNAFITREYHAWNKVKIDDVWYNCDSTLDRDDVIEEKLPTYALLSDEIYTQLGRPTVKVFRHSCKETMSLDEKKNVFPTLKGDGIVVVFKEIIEFEKNVDEYGNPKQLPEIPKLYPWTKMFYSLKKFVKKYNININNFIDKIKNKIKNSFSKKKIELIHSDTDSINIVEDTVEDTERIPASNSTNNDCKNKPSWELSNELLKDVKKVEHIQVNKNNSNERINQSEVQNADEKGD